MERKAVSGILLTLLFTSMLTLALNIQQADASGPPATEWTRSYGRAGGDSAHSVVQTSDGGYALAGHTWSFGAGGWDFWLVKVDSSGNHEWNKTYGGAGEDSVNSVVQTSDGGYVVAGFTTSFGAGGYDAWLVKVDSSGNVEWSKTYGGAGDEVATALVATGDGGYTLAGGTDSFGAGPYRDFWLVKVDSSGNHEWNQTYGGSLYECATSIVVTVDGGYALAGDTYSFGAGGEDFWLVKVDSSGNHEWNKTYGGAMDDWAFSVVQTSDGGYALAGGTESFGAGGEDFWLVKVDSLGNVQWNKTYGGASTDRAWSVVKTSDGGYALAGGTWSFGAGGEDFWLVKVDSSGNHEWNKTYGGADVDGAYSVVQTSDGGYALAGTTWSFGAGNFDFWLVKIAPEAKPTLTITITNLKSESTKTIMLELVDEDHNGLVSIDIHNRILSAIRRTLGTTTFDFPGEYTATQGAWTVTLSCQNDYTITLT